MDKGPWKAVQNHEGEWHVASEDFEHDVWLNICGDFASTTKRKAYCEWLATTLNGRAGMETFPVQQRPCHRCGKPVFCTDASMVAATVAYCSIECAEG
jgi:hypothetical protein